MTFIGSFGALFNGTGKILLGSSLDYFKFKPVYTCILAAIFISLIMVHFSSNNAYAFGACMWINFMGDGSMTSMLPVVSLNVFGLRRGTEVFGYLFSEFGFAALVGVIVVGSLQPTIHYEGMLFVCLGFSCIAAILTYFYNFEERLSYSKLMGFKKDDDTRKSLL